MISFPKLPRVAIRGPRRVPLLGPVGSLLRFFGDPVGTLLKLKRDYGELVALADGDASMICALNSDFNRQILSDHRLFFNFAGSPLPVPKDSSTEHLLDALTSMNGDRHKQHRRLLMPAFQKSALDGYRATTVAVAERALAKIPIGSTIDLNEAMVELTLRIALKCLFDIEPSEHEENLGVMATEFLAGLISPAAALFPFMVPGTPYYRFRKLSDRLEARMRAIIAERRAQTSERRDMLSILIEAHDEDGTRLTDSELLGHSAVMYVAGHETTAYTLSWTLFLLSQHGALCGRRRREPRRRFVLVAAAPRSRHQRESANSTGDALSVHSTSDEWLQARRPRIAGANGLHLEPIDYASSARSL